MSYKKTDEVIQWAGTVFILAMYALMNFFPESRPWNIITGLGGAACFFTWSYRVANRQQMIVNGVAIALCCLGLYKVWG